mmetsp:Transcript_52406/g.97011  ORF Transcript_52406/g.97011 Transcript_52406/m.97011 type:complete len:516 (+) Transcript_52406:145-1692(+)
MKDPSLYEKPYAGLDSGPNSLDASQVSTQLDATAISTLASTDSATTNRTLTAWQLLLECETDDEGVIFAGIQSDPEDSDVWDYRGLEACGVPRPDGERRRRAQHAKERENAERGRHGRDGEPHTGPPRHLDDLILPRGDSAVENPKFICILQVGLEDDDEFCLVKRILGKGGNNMRAIADSCNAKVRLRGIGSGFLEGADGKEANMPLQLNVSCVDYEAYEMAVDRVVSLLRDLYKHYRKYIRSKGLPPPDLRVNLEEVRRDDQNINLLASKANRSPSQRERDRKAREAERKQVRENMFYRERQIQARGMDSDVSMDSETEQLYRMDDLDARDDHQRPATTLPGGIPMPTTAAGRRAAARVGGAAAAARASAAAREVERQQKMQDREEAMRQREQDRVERDRSRWDSYDQQGSKGKGRSSWGQSSYWSSNSWTAAGSKYNYSYASAPVGAAPDSWSNWKGKATGADSDSWSNYGKGKGRPSAPPPPPPPPDEWDNDNSVSAQEVWGRWRRKDAKE